MDARLRDGSRVNVVLKPVAVNGPIMTIRKFPSEAITMEQLVRMGSLTDRGRKDDISKRNVGLYSERGTHHNH